MNYLVNQVAPSLIGTIPFILVVGFGFKYHGRKVLDQANDKANAKQTTELVSRLGDHAAPTSKR